MKQEVYQKIARRYKEKWDEIIRGSKPGFCRAGDIVPNLLIMLDAYARPNEFRIEPDSAKRHFLEITRALREYFRLLEKFQEFRKEELNKPGGFFPEFGGYLGAKLTQNPKEEGFFSYKTHYPFYAKQRLEALCQNRQS